MNAIETNFKVGTKVKVYNPYGSFVYEDIVKSISPKERCIKVGNTKYYPKKKNYAESSLTCWGKGTIEVIC